MLLLLGVKSRGVELDMPQLLPEKTYPAEVKQYSR